MSSAGKRELGPGAALICADKYETGCIPAGWPVHTGAGAQLLRIGGQPASLSQERGKKSLGAGEQPGRKRLKKASWHRAFLTVTACILPSPSSAF